MQNPESTEIKQPQEGLWQIYQPKDESLSVLKAFNVEIKNILKLILSLCILYLILTLLSPLSIFVVCLLIGTSIKLIKLKTAEIRKEGLINKLSPRWRQLLYEKSLFDIYSDLLYFPLITKIIGAFIKPLIAKPHPQELHHTFQSLPSKFQHTIARKGLLSLAPSLIQQAVIDSQRKDHVSQVFGVETWEWKNYEKYQQLHDKVHQQTISRKIVQKIDQKVSWPAFTVMASIVSLGVYKMKPQRIQKMVIQNGSFVGILLVSLIALIKIKKRIDEAKKVRETQKHMETLRIKLLDKSK